MKLNNDYDYKLIIGQIISLGHTLKDNDINHLMSSIFAENISLCDNQQQFFDENLQLNINTIKMHLQITYENIITYYIINNIYKSINTYDLFNQLLKNNCILNDDNINQIHTFITNSMKNETIIWNNFANQFKPQKYLNVKLYNTLCKKHNKN